MKHAENTTAKIFGGALRRCISILCVSLFIFSAFAHAGCFVPPANAAQTMEVAAGLLGDTTDDTGLPDLGAAHCHGCTAAAVPMAANALSPMSTVSRPAAAVGDELSAIDRQFEPPPPKA